jgi:hypothetical protein
MKARNAFSDLGAWVNRKWRQRRLQKEKAQTIQMATEVVVDATDPRIRQGRGYRAKLGPAVEEAMRFADELVDGLPGPILVGKERWATDPYVRAFFSSVDEMREVLRLDRELNAFFKGQPFTECYALLTMKRREQTVFGTEQVGGIIRRDVARTAVAFLDHRVVSPCRTENETRMALKTRTLSVLSEYASEGIVSLGSEREEFQAQREAVRVKLKVLQEEFRGSQGSEMGMDGEGEKRIRDARDLLAEIERRIAHANLFLNDPARCLEHVKAVLSRPGDHMRRETVALRLNPMGIKIGRDAPEDFGEITLTELELRKGVRRVTVVAKFPRPGVLES